MFASFPPSQRPIITSEEIIKIAKERKFVEGIAGIQKPLKKEFYNFLTKLDPVKNKYGDFDIPNVYTRVYYYNASENKFSDTPQPGYKAITNLAAHPNNGNRFPMYVDDNYLGQFNATFIPDEKLILSAGPQNDTELELFLKTHVLNTNVKLQTKKIIALGPAGKDFCDYSVSPRENKAYGSIALTVDEKSITTHSYSQIYDFFDGIKPINIVNSQLNISDGKSTKTVDATVIPIQDNGVIDVSTEWVKDFILELADAKENILMHCAAGVGRTGHLALMILILKHATEIFKAENPEKALDKINQLVDKLREKRICMIGNELQFHQAISNAYTIYRYQLEKKKVAKEEVVQVMSEEKQPILVNFSDTPPSLALHFANEKLKKSFLAQTGLEDEKIYCSKSNNEKSIFIKLRFIPDTSEYALDFSTSTQLDKFLKTLSVKPVNELGEKLQNGQTEFHYKEIDCRRYLGPRKKGGRDQCGSLYFSTKNNPLFNDQAATLQIAADGGISPVKHTTTPLLGLF